ncbi:MAG: hypothetical protein BM557_04715 [Flavobacterium sp. MedPE-SWcel]|uniref:S8 family serine peptidase n=1 Tax=uncultured Flavobacterium sp. TaxID=165435 RepID=UPI000911F70E|nr:S8 family serine peptidase [uncultured Flavobacterium sp.]OIQ21062.1 MAG: hypothetical protein BM557_04715 [Flavobacterium sp. MedPE-SWcel]
MKKNTVKLFVLALALGSSVAAFAQTPEQRAEIVKHYDREANMKLAAEFAEKSEASYKRALELAAVKGWPLKKQKEGYTSTLVGVTENDEPIYIQPYNDGGAGSAAFTARVNLVRTGGFFGLDLNGQDMVMGIWEPGDVRTTHTDLAGAVTVMDGSNFTTHNSDNGHATHVSGTMMGRGILNPSARGIAYEATLLSHDAQGDTSEALARATDDGLLVSNHSYGWDPEDWPEWRRGAYTAESAAWDQITMAAEYYLPVFAAGNSRVGEAKDLLISDGTSKNIVVVAATYGVSNTNPTSGSIAMSNFSSYGPTDDRRIKPDIATKGVAVLSCYSQSNSDYTSLQGTSMASPGVAGSLTLMQQHYSNLHGSFMRSATLRGLMIHTADEAGFFDGPDHRFGWGLIDTGSAVQLLTNADSGVGAIVEENILAQSATYTKNVTADDVETLKVTICWTDPVTSSLINTGTHNSTTPVLTNDLDIRVTKDGETFFPWRLSDIVETAPIKADNFVDNVEVIEIDNPTPGSVYTVTVSHKGNLQGFSSQKYSLIIDGISDVNGVSDKIVSKLGVYPNPATDVVNITLDAGLDASSSTVTLYDLQGRQVKNFGSFTGSVDVSDISSGMYVLMVDVNNGAYTESKKIVIK